MPPDLANLVNSTSPSPSRCRNIEIASYSSDLTTSLETLATHDSMDKVKVYYRRRRRHGAAPLDRDTKPHETCLDDYVNAWVQNKLDSGAAESHCFLPFLVAAPKSVECPVCHNIVYPGEEVLCSSRGCQHVYHLNCAKATHGFCTLKKFKCPHHACFLCKQRPDWRCIRCCRASHVKCSAWPHSVTHLENQPGRAICWRHPSDWRLEKKDVFCQLSLPYVEEEFNIDVGWKDVTIKDKVEPHPAVRDVATVNKMESSSFVQNVVIKNKMKPSPFVHIKRNLYLIKKKRDIVGGGIGCTSCRSSSTCSEDCVCRVQCISCSKVCGCCSEVCTNRPFRKEKKIKVVKTELCGWGVEAAESINKGDFVIEYIGEVIDDALCEQRLWDMKFKGVQNFYMCEIRKNFTIDATFKGNSSRFLNHSCNPNCVLEKWQVEGETHVGVFAARSVKVGEPLTYDYRFVQFGPEVKCYCGASNCQGYLGSKKKICTSIDFYWGSKRKRTPQIRVAVITL